MAYLIERLQTLADCLPSETCAEAVAALRAKDEDVKFQFWRAEAAEQRAERLAALLKEARHEIRGNFGTYAATLRERIDAELKP